MAEQTASNIYDLGYQHYAGARLGRRHAIASLYWYSLRAVFGIGRPLSSKIGPMLLAAITFLPAIVQLGIASIFSGDIDILEPADYYGYIAIVLAIFIAVVAPDIAGRDQRNRTLSLYFSRALNRVDYALSKYAALVTALLCLTFVPQVVAFLGNASANDDFGGYVSDNLGDLPAAFASGLLFSALLAAIGLAIAAQTGRRAYSTIGIIVALVLTTTLGLTLYETLDSDSGRYALLLSPLQVAEGFTYWIFGTPPSAEEPVAEADLWGGLYALTAVAATLVLVVVIIRRYERIQA